VKKARGRRVRMGEREERRGERSSNDVNMCGGVEREGVQDRALGIFIYVASEASQPP
jgi:hypothetical protein